MAEDTNAALLPSCHLCGEETIEAGESAMLSLRGEWHYSPTYDAPLFVLDPGIALVVMELPNGQLALVIDTDNSHRLQHSHEECMEHLVNEVFFEEEDHEFYEELED